MVRLQNVLSSLSRSYFLLTSHPPSTLSPSPSHTPAHLSLYSPSNEIRLKFSTDGYSKRTRAQDSGRGPRTLTFSAKSTGTSKRFCHEFHTIRGHNLIIFEGQITAVILSGGHNQMFAIINFNDPTCNTGSYWIFFPSQRVGSAMGRRLREYYSSPSLTLK